MKTAPEGIPCAICASSDLILLRDRPMGVPDSFRHGGLVVRNYLCRRCGTARGWPVPTESQLEEYYKLEFRCRLQTDDEKKYFVGIQFDAIERQRKRFFNILKNIRRVRVKDPGFLSRGSRVLDLGCYSGEILYGLRKEFEINPLGVELTESILPYAKNVNNLEVLPSKGDLLKSVPAGDFDLILMIHSLEHIPRPKETLEMIHKKLAGRKGYFYCEVPDFLGNTSYGIAHTHHFCEANLRYLFELVGFEVVLAERHDTNLTVVGRNNGRTSGSAPVLPDTGRILSERIWFSRTLRIRSYLAGVGRMLSGIPDFLYRVQRRIRIELSHILGTASD